MVVQTILLTFLESPKTTSKTFVRNDPVVFECMWYKPQHIEIYKYIGKYIVYRHCFISKTFTDGK